MKMKYLVIASAVMLALAGCEKKERPVAENGEKANPKSTEVVVEERALPTCTDEALTSRVASLVQDNMRKSTIEALKDLPNLTELDGVIKEKLSAFAVKVSDVKGKNECTAKLHVSLPEADIVSVDEAFAKAGLGSLAEQASKLGLEFVDGHLVGDLVYQLDGEALSIKSDDNSVLDLTSAVLAQAVLAQNAPKPTTDKPAQPKVTPVTPAVRPSTPAQQPRANNNTSSNSNAQATPKPRAEPKEQPRAEPRQETRQEQARQTQPRQTERPAEPRVEPRQPQQVQQPKVNTTPTPKAEPKPEPKPEPKVEKPEPKAEPSVSHKPVTDNSAKIEIVESDDTY